MKKMVDSTKNINVATRVMELVFGDRENDYDHPVRDFIGTAMKWTAFLRRKLRPGCVITPLDFPLMMILAKSSRESHKHKDDNTEDMVGYVLTHERVMKYLEYHGLDANDLMGILLKVQCEIQKSEKYE